MSQRPLPFPIGLRAKLAGYALELAAIRLQLLLRKANFNPAQLRIPAGQPGGGQWTSDGGGGDASETNPNDASIVPVAGKLDALRRFGKLTAQEFASRFCRGSIKGQLPGEFKDVAIEDIINIARGGDHRARTCLKLLGRKEYRK
jgi:hypothetical protein